MRRGMAVMTVMVGVLWAASISWGSPVSATTTGTTSTPASPASYVVGGDPDTIRTRDGVVTGTAGALSRQFQGIPFAQPPVGPLRWQAPKPVTPWTGTLQATKPSAECPQIVSVVNAFGGNENCLYLNVYAPKAVPTKPLPVMVWIYGGAFTEGSSTDDNPVNFAANDNIVSVSFNYRLGPLGFLALPQLAGQDPHHSTGNLGLLDQQAALRWVKANIASFGGNPDDVTVFGESAGGISVCAQLVSPSAAGLFEKAITESGPCTLAPQKLGAAEAQGDRLAAKLGCPSGSAMLACLRSKPVEQVVEALPPPPSVLFGSGTSWGPVADGVTLPTNTEAALESGHFHKVPMIIGANRDEGRLFVALQYNANGTSLTDAQWASQVDAYFGPKVGPEVQKEYPLADYPDAGAAFGQAVGDAVLACPAVVSAEIVRKYVPVYEYQYNYTPDPFILPTPGIVLGAFHSSELTYVFDGPTESSGNFTFTPSQQQLATTVSGAWARFAATGSPAGAGLSWPRLGSATGSYLAINTPSSVATAMKQKQCQFWSKSGWSSADRLPGQ